MERTLVQLFPNQTAYIQDQEIPIMIITRAAGHNTIQVPLYRDQIDVGSIQSDVDIAWMIEPTSIVTKGNSQYIGQVVEVTDERVILNTDGQRTTVREYDEISESRYLMGSTDTQGIDSSINMSYMTTGIGSSIVHTIDILANHLSSTLTVENRTALSIGNAHIEYVVSEPVQEVAFLAADVLPRAEAQATPSGTVYVVQGIHDIPQGYSTSIPLIDEGIEIDILYTIDAPNGRSNALYTIEWISPQELPRGTLFVLRGNKLETRTSINTVTANQVQSTPLLSTASVYAQGNISRVSRTGEDEQSITRVVLEGTIFNTLPQQVEVELRYRIYNATMITPGIERDGEYVVWDYTLKGNSNTPYSHTLEIAQ